MFCTQPCVISIAFHLTKEEKRLVLLWKDDLEDATIRIFDSKEKQVTLKLYTNKIINSFINIIKQNIQLHLRQESQESQTNSPNQLLNQNISFVTHLMIDRVYCNQIK